eukprot:638392_1
MSSLPSRTTIACGGISMILAQILFLAKWILDDVSDAIYNVSSQDDLTKLHTHLSSDSHRYKVEISTCFMWISFPLLLCALYALQGLFSVVVHDTASEMFIYIMEQSFVIWMSVMYIILPAIHLVAASSDWSFVESTASDQQVPTGYYMQLYVSLLTLEMIDCAAIADATFTLSIFIAVRVLLYGNHTYQTHKYLQFRNIVLFSPTQTSVMITEIGSCCCVIALFIIFCIILFEFAESGFFSPAGHARFLIVVVVLIKIYIGFKVFVCSTKTKYGEIQKLVSGHHEEDIDTNFHAINEQNLR